MTKAVDRVPPSQGSCLCPRSGWLFPTSVRRAAAALSRPGQSNRRGRWQPRGHVMQHVFTEHVFSNMGSATYAHGSQHVFRWALRQVHMPQEAHSLLPIPPCMRSSTQPPFSKRRPGSAGGVAAQKRWPPLSNPPACRLFGAARSPRGGFVGGRTHVVRGEQEERVVPQA